MSLSTSSVPQPPPQLSFADNTYLVLTVPPTSPLVKRSDAASPVLTHPVQVSYVAPVGALADEHIFEVSGVTRESDRWDELEREVLAALRRQEGVREVSVMDPPKQRFKRGGEF